MRNISTSQINKLVDYALITFNDPMEARLYIIGELNKKYLLDHVEFDKIMNVVDTNLEIYYKYKVHK